MALTAEPRTNSLAFAKTDCHTCTANLHQCDRKRPRCSQCTGKNIVCGGYPMQLTWSKNQPTKPRAATSSEQIDDPFFLDPLSLRASIHSKDRNGRSRPHQSRKFKFVAEQSTDRKQSSSKASETRVKQSSNPLCRIQMQRSIQKSNNEKVKSICRSTPVRPSRNSLNNSVKAASQTLRNEPIDVSDSLMMCYPAELSSDAFNLWRWYSPGATCNENLGMLGDPMLTPIGLGSPVLHQNLFGKYEALLNRYDQEFCVIPLSGDIPSNPFRCRSETCRGSQSLLHAILAVSCFHASRQTKEGNYLPFDVVNHQNTAIKLYRDELDTCCTGPQGAQLLDTAMILFLFNATQSAFGNWATQISDVHKLLDLSGGAKFWIDNHRVQAQVVMLLWWDATIALLSRQGCLLPYSYFEALLALEDDRYWSFFDLIGCPRQLVVPVMQLAILAEENERAKSMRWTIFDLTLVDEIQASIINWKNPSPEIDNDMSEEEMQQQRDRWNCTEAWRYGLLIYITRVFLWNNKTSPSSKLVFYARLILEHVNSCRQTAIVQKQALLPIFFAGCETKDEFSRQNIQDYCQYWGTISGYNLFSSASSLLEDLWMEQDESCSDEAWWGSIIDKKQRYEAHVAPMQFCFG